jgi:hypothetical protein
MRNFKVLAAVSVALVMAGGVSAKEKRGQPKPRKVCRTEQMPNRITPQRICRTVPASGSAAQDNQRKDGDARQAGNDRS